MAEHLVCSHPLTRGGRQQVYSRQVKQFSQLAPNVGRLKVYIVDAEAVSTLLPTWITLESIRNVSALEAVQKSPTATDPSQTRVVILTTLKVRPNTDESWRDQNPADEYPPCRQQEKEVE